jgi:asparagine synthase (glutamine-hydrolysing)
MCGIAGAIDNVSGAAERREIVSRMCDAIQHRGPDDHGIYHGPNVALGMQRLSIIDVDKGHQPISNEDGSIWIVFNGEIYNYLELRDQLESLGHRFKTNSDTEVIVHLYEEKGEACVERLRGMFAFAIWDSREQRLFAARDRVGKKPFHYVQTRNGLVFGSEVKAVLQHPDVERSVNPQGIADFLAYGYVPDPKTAFTGINKLSPGHLLSYRNSRLSIRRYWDFDYTNDLAPREEQYYIDELRRRLLESVRVRLVSEVPLGAFLSGGIDSSAIVAMMSRESAAPVKTFSIGFSDAEFDELKYARVTAGHLQTDHHEFVVSPDVCRLVDEIVWHHDEPFADVSSIPAYIVSKMAREHVTVVLSGDGGDELFGGYGRYLVDLDRRKYERIPSLIRRGALAPLSRALPRSAYGKNFLGNIALDGAGRYIESVSYFNDAMKRELLSPEYLRQLDGYESARAFRNIFYSQDAADRLERLLYLDSKTYLPGDILTKVDRMSMAHSIETRVPLLDHQLVEFVQKIPIAMKIRGRDTKYIFKRAMRGILPDEIIDRPKQGFDVPINKWLNNELRSMLDDVLNDSRTRQRGYFNRRAIESLVQEHRRGRRDNARHLWGLLTLELWHRAFIDRQPDIRFEGAKNIAFHELAIGEDERVRRAS